MATLLHPNGFIQHDLPGGRRLHIWSPDIPQAQKVRTPIHNHTFDFESRVIMGRLANLIYRYKGGVPETLFHGHVVKVYHAIGPELVNSGLVGVATEDQFSVYLPGDAYRRPHNLFHASEGLGGLTATVMTKMAVGLAPLAHVLVPYDVEPDNEFRRDQYPEEQLMPWVQKVLDYMEARNA